MITKLPIPDWTSPIASHLCEEAIHHLESGQVLLFDPLSFQLSEEEKKFLTPSCIEKGRKNISYDVNHHSIKGVHPKITHESAVIKNMMNRYAKHTESLLSQLIPGYQPLWKIGRTSFRPVEIFSREPLSPRKDDRLLHVDAFPTTPVGGKRILRFFTNINPNDAPRRWRLGETFSEVTERFVPNIRRPLPFSRKLKQTFKITRSYQTLYDYYMLKLHNTMKEDQSYQESYGQLYDFPAGASWLVYTDMVSHAAIAGQFVLEQTFYLPIEAMKIPTRSPLQVLEQLLKRPLV